MKKTENQMVNQVVRVTKVLRKSGCTNIEILFEDNRILITPNTEELDWEILEGIKEITDKPRTTWSVEKDGNENLIIVLENEKEE